MGVSNAGISEVQHQCKARTLHNIEGEPEVEDDSEEEDVIAEPSLEEECNDGEVTLNAISVHSSPSTLKLTAQLKNREIKVLVDSRSTKSFIDLSILQKV